MSPNRREIQRWLDGNGVDAASVRWFIDKSTGDNLDRPEFERLQAAVFLGEVKTVVVWKLDRLSRNLRDGINTLADWCDRGLRVVSVTQQIDFNGAVGNHLVGIHVGLSAGPGLPNYQRKVVIEFNKIQCCSS